MGTFDLIIGGVAGAFGVRSYYKHDEDDILILDGIARSRWL